MEIVNFTKTSLEALNAPLKGRTYITDEKVKGLSLYITCKGIRTFYVRKNLNGRDQKIVIGQFPEVSIDNARKQALNYMGMIAFGNDPIAERRKNAQQKITLGAFYKEYIERHCKVNKKSWRYDEREIEKFLSHWFNYRLSEIKQEDVRKLFDRITRDNGPYQANRILERLRGLYNKAIEWGWNGSNPAIGIKKNRERSRDRFILPAELPCFHKALADEANTTAKDCIQMLLLCGARKTNTLKMRFEQINWDWHTWRIPDTKNGEPQIVTLVARAMDILRRRQDAINSPWVFPSDLDNNKHFVNLKRGWSRVLRRATVYFWMSDRSCSSFVTELIKLNTEALDYALLYNDIVKKAKAKNISLPDGLIDLRIHDIRRTIGSYQAITGASLQIIGKSLGHKSSQSTQVYARLDLDPVKASLEKAVDTIFKLDT